jgi:RloB-like protein
MLIVCEGTKTEPLYFSILKDEGISKGVWDNVVIVPEPPRHSLEKEDKKSKNKKRSFKNTEYIVPERSYQAADEIEKKYLNKGTDRWAMPLNFVKQARDKWNEFDESWAVFDNDGHPAQKDAFALASEKDKPVNIAFSSRSFEQWILLHFEKNSHPFEATACKISKNELNCMTINAKEGSCIGDKCLVGYIRKNHIPHYSKTTLSVLKKLSDEENLTIALSNTAWLRAKQSNILRGHKNKPYLLNPYVTVDVLVKQLLGITEHIEWVEFNQSISLPNLDIVVELMDKKHLKMTFTNKNKTVFVLNPTNLMGKLYCVSVGNKRHDLTLENTFTLLSNQTGSCLFTIVDDSTEQQIHFKIEDFHLILDI